MADEPGGTGLLSTTLVLEYQLPHVSFRILPRKKNLSTDGFA